MNAGKARDLPMDPSLTDTLCTQCGLCCDGSLFGDVELAGRREATGLEILGLEIEDDGDREVLIQPCRALQGTRCSIYEHRPQCCRTFECRLLRDVRRGAVSVERAQARIAETREQIGRVKGLIIQLERRGSRLPLKERCAEVLARNAGTSPESIRKHAELSAAMSGVEVLLRNTFLEGTPERRPRHD
jgi:Fe-S-cluster containining protein